MSEMSGITMKYVGYKDRTFVPRKNQKKWYHPQGEKETKHMLCVLNKVGNAKGATCKIEYLRTDTLRARQFGRLKRNHYWYVLDVDYLTEDEELFEHHIKVRTGEDIGFGFGHSSCDAGACNGGFCD